MLVVPPTRAGIRRRVRPVPSAADELSEDVDQLGCDFTNLQGEVERLTGEVGDLREELKAVQGEVEDLRGDLLSLADLLGYSPSHESEV